MNFTKELLSQIKITPLIDTLHLESISDDEYFSQRYSDFISNSRMGYINPAQNGSPYKYFEEWGKKRLFTSSLAFGTAVHELALQPDGFFLCEDVAAPTAKVGLMADWLWCYAKKDGLLPADDLIREAAIVVDYYKGIPTANQMTKVKEAIKPYFRDRFKFEQDSLDERQPIYLDDKSRDRLRSTMESLNNNKEVQKLLHPLDLTGEPLMSENERTILLDVRVDLPEDSAILRLKAKLDNFTIDKVNNIITVNDVKTTGKMCSLFNEAVKGFHYYREIAFYSWLLSLCAKKFFEMENPTIKGNFLVVETIPAYWSSVVPMKSTWFQAGIKEFMTLIKMIAYYTINGYEERVSD